jgi:primosomal protein N' (replication factor Y)
MKFSNKIIEEKFLTKEQMELAEYISDEYFTPLGKTLKHFLPRRAKARKKDPILFPTLQKLRATKTEAIIVKSFNALKNNAVASIDIFSVENPHRLFALLAKKISFQKRQVLFLVPEIMLLREWETAFLQYFPREKIAVLSSQLATGPYFEMWEKIRQGVASIILATRQGIFAPFQNLSLIVLLEEQDESYKQWDMSPRYDGKRVAERLALLHNAKLLLASGTPSIESQHRLKQKLIISLVPQANIPPLGKVIEIVNLRLERFRKNYSPLSQTLIAAIRAALDEKKQILLYIHRQGMNAFSVCENCKNIFRCPQSGHTLTATKDGTFRCLSCNFKTGSFPNCPHCGHLSFRHIGFGTERVEREAIKLFPHAKIFRADGSTMRASKSTEQLYEKIASGDIDILIGTQMILKGPTLPKLALVGMIDMDSLLAFPDFRADEKLWHILTRAVRQTSTSYNSRRKPGRVIVQTFHPESAFFQRISTLDSEAVVKQMLAEREDLFYPPFSRLISIACQGKTAKSAETAAQKLHQSLKIFFPNEGAHHRLSPPQAATKKKHQKVFQSTLLLCTPPKPLAENIKSFLRKNNFAYIIDVDPISFF